MDKISSKMEIPEEMLATIYGTSASLGIVGIFGGLLGPGADLFVIAPNWIVMTVKLANQAGHSMDKQKAKKITMAVVTGGGLFMGGAKAATAVLAWATAPFTAGASLAASAAANAALNSTFTYAYGRAAARFFLQTTKIDNIEMAVRVLIALVGIELGITTGLEDLVA